MIDTPTSKRYYALLMKLQSVQCQHQHFVGTDFERVMFQFMDIFHAYMQAPEPETQLRVIRQGNLHLMAARASLSMLTVSGTDQLREVVDEFSQFVREEIHAFRERG